MNNYFNIQMNVVQNAPLPINSMFKSFASSKQKKILNNINYCKAFSIIRTNNVNVTADDTYFNKIVFINLSISKINYLLDTVTSVLKSIKYQCVICAHHENTVCFFAARKRFSKLRTYESKMKYLCYTRFYNSDEVKSQFYLDQYTYRTVSELYQKLLDDFDKSLKHTITLPMAKQIFNYCTSMEMSNTEKAQNQIRKSCKLCNILCSNTEVKEVVDCDDFYLFLKNIGAYLSGDNFIDMLYHFQNYETDFKVKLSNDLQELIDNHKSSLLNNNNDRKYINVTTNNPPLRMASSLGNRKL